MNKKSRQPGSRLCIPWPRKGDKLFMAGSDSRFNACLNFTPTSTQWSGYARGYKLAADLVVDYVAAAARDQDILVYPVVFLYRQYVELMLKSLIYDLRTLLRRAIRVPGHHDIGKLWALSGPLLAEAFPQEPKKDFENVGDYLRQLSEADPTSAAFRYPQTKAGKASLPGIRVINLRNLKRVMDCLGSFLDGASSGLDAALCAMGEMLESRVPGADHHRPTLPINKATSPAA